MSETASTEVLWSPSSERIADAEVTRFRHWLAENRDVELADFCALLEWSTTDLEGYWSAVWEYFSLARTVPNVMLADERMPGTVWAPGTELNLAEYALRHVGDDAAVRFRNEAGQTRTLTRDELRARVAEAAAGLRQLGVMRGDRVVGVMPNIVETMVAFYACASLGAIWSCCSPDFGARSIIERFEQIAPKVLIAVDGYSYNGRDFDRTELIGEVREDLPTLEATVVVPYLRPETPISASCLSWNEMLRPSDTLVFESLPFDHPLWVLYTSGTTGKPKAIVHSHGGALLGGVAALGLCYDVDADDTYFWFCTTGWAVWNLLVTATMRGACVVLYDGSPTYPSREALWEICAEWRVTWFGAGAPLMIDYRRRGLAPGSAHDLSTLRTVATTGAAMPAEGTAWVYSHVSSDVWVVSISGGTDTLVPFVAGAPVLPVRAGRIQSRCLGTDVQAFTDDGRPVVGEVGELVLVRPIPSLPVRLWGDHDGSRMHDTYFTPYPGVWRHGDWVRFDADGSVEILGRSDATIKRSGVRIGSAEIYAALDEHPLVSDSLVLDLGDHQMVLFVVPSSGRALSPELDRDLKDWIRSRTSPRHVPDLVLAVGDVPRTLNGKRMEVPVKRVLQGTPLSAAVQIDSVGNPAAFKEFLALRRAEWARPAEGTSHPSATRQSAAH